MPTSRRGRTRRAGVGSTQTKGEFRAHFKKLGLKSESDYREWCKKRGLGLGIFKSAGQKRRELDLAEQEHGRDLLARRRGHTRRPGKTLRQLYDGSMPTAPWVRTISMR